MLPGEQSSPDWRLRALWGTRFPKQIQTSSPAYSSPLGFKSPPASPAPVPDLLSLTLHSNLLGQLAVPCHTCISSRLGPHCSFCLECPPQPTLQSPQIWILPPSQGTALMTPPPGSLPALSLYACLLTFHPHSPGGHRPTHYTGT